MTGVYTIIGLLIALGISHFTVYRWGKKSMNGYIQSKDIRIENLVKKNADMQDLINMLQNQLYVATNMHNNDINPIDIM